MSEKYNIERFYPVHNEYYKTALEEMKSGRKQSHWMWYIFPQLKTLGYSGNAIYYGLENTEEAKEFCKDSFLGGNLREICGVLLECETDNALQLVGYPDNLKLCSSMTLFYQATNEELFRKVLEKFYGGKQDELTLNQIK